MGTIHEWAPLVYGRTLKSDRWWRVAPTDWVSAPAFAWARDHVLAATRGPEELRRPRWVLLQDDRYRMFGVACLAELITDRMAMVRTRRLYTFVGLAARRGADGRFPPVPPLATLEARGERLFGELYLREVGADWEREDYQLATVRAGEYAPVPELDRLLARAPAPEAGPSAELNPSSGRVAVWPDRYGEVLWAAAAAESRPVSLCLGYRSDRHGVEGPFRDVTAFDVVRRRTVDLPRAGPSPPPEAGDGAQPPAEAAGAGPDGRGQGAYPGARRADADAARSAPEQARPGGDRFRHEHGLPHAEERGRGGDPRAGGFDRGGAPGAARKGGSRHRPKGPRPWTPRAHSEHPFEELCRLVNSFGRAIGKLVSLNEDPPPLPPPPPPPTPPPYAERQPSREAERGDGTSPASPPPAVPGVSSDDYYARFMVRDPAKTSGLLFPGDPPPPPSDGSSSGGSEASREEPEEQ